MNPHGIDAPSAHARILHPTLRFSHSHSHTLVGGSFIRAGSIWYEGGSGPQYALRNCRPQIKIGRTQLDSQNRDCKGQKRVRARAARVKRGLQTAGRHKATTEPCTPNELLQNCHPTHPLCIFTGAALRSHPRQHAARVEVGISRVHDGAAGAIPLRNDGKALRPPHKRRHSLPCARHGTTAQRESSGHARRRGDNIESSTAREETKACTQTSTNNQMREQLTPLFPHTHTPPTGGAGAEKSQVDTGT